MAENLRAGRAPVNSFGGRLIRALGRPISHEKVIGQNGYCESCRWAQDLRGAGVSPAGFHPGRAPQNRRRDAGATKSRRKSRWGARNALRAVYTADPGKAKGPLLRLNNDIVSPLEAIVVILIHRDAFDPPSATPRRNHQAAAARQTIRGEFPNNSSGNTNGARIVELAIQKEYARKNPWHWDHSEVNALEDFYFLPFPGTKIDPVTQCEG